MSQHDQKFFQCDVEKIEWTEFFGKWVASGDDDDDDDDDERSTQEI
jgi:hypothetical protein